MTTDVRTFHELGVDDAVVAALADAGITEPFPIQALSVPMALTGADVIGQARTGTGKTLAFGIPLVQGVDPAAGHIQALVIVPTRELCLQVHDDLVIAGATRGVRVVAAYGGRAIDPQSEAIAAGAAIIVGTPGRLLDLCRRRLLDLSRVRHLVLDEADEMLDMGFLPDVEQLIERCGEDRQTLLYSATMPSEVIRLARRYMDKPTFMRSDVAEAQQVAPETRQLFFSCHRLDKPAVVARILASPTRGRTLIFTRTKRMADVLAKELKDRRIKAGVIHSDLRQEARERSLAGFRKGTVDVLCATEVAARGLDIDEVTHVINYDCPDDERMYLHRIGRTGRAGAAGVAVTLAVWNELARLDMIKRTLDIDEPTHEVFSTSPILDELFGTPDAGRRADDGASDGAADDEGGRGTTGEKPARQERRPRSRTRRRRRTRTVPVRADDDSSSGSSQDGSSPGGGSSGPTADVAAATADPAASNGDAATGADSAATDDGPRSGRTTRRRTRTRRRTAPGAADGDGAAGSDDADGVGAREQQSGGGAAPGTTRRGADDDVTAGDGGGGDDSGGATASTGSGGSSSKRSRSGRRRGGRRGRGGRGGRGGRDEQRGPGRDAGTGGEQRHQRTEPSISSARGDGQPALHRPMLITHLP